MQDKKVKYLTELLGVNEDLHMEFYSATKQLLEQGIIFPMHLHLDNQTPENIFYSLLGLYRNYLQLVCSTRHMKVMDDYPGKMLIWEDDIVEVKLLKESEVLWESNFCFKSIEARILDKMVEGPQLDSYARGEYSLFLKLKTPGFERKFNEKTQFTADQKMTREIRQLKEKIVFAHQDSLLHLNSTEHDFYGQLSRVIHRLKIWGYDFSKADYYSENFTKLIQEQVVLSSLHFRHTQALALLNQMLLESYDNDHLMKEVESRLHKEETKLVENFLHLNSFLKT